MAIHIPPMIVWWGARAAYKYWQAEKQREPQADQARMVKQPGRAR
jgi:hypothetical protein